MSEACSNTHIAPPTFNLLQAPEDVQRSVLLALDNKELVLCVKVCRYLADFIKNDIAVRYKFELALSGRIDGTRSVAVIDRLTALREHRARFDAGDHPLRRARRHPFGFLLTCSGKVVVKDTVSFWRPATTFSGIDQLSVVHSTQMLGLVGFWTGICVADLSQDLLIFLRRHSDLNASHEFCIYSLKEGQPHPLASRSHIPLILDHRRSTYARINGEIQILGNLIAWNDVDGGQYGMKVINWKTGVTVWHLTTQDRRWRGHLISETYVVVVAVQSLQIYSFDPRRASQPPSSSDAEPALCVLALPAWSDSALSADRADHTCVSSHIRFPSPPGPDDSPLYRHDPDLTVLALYFEFNLHDPIRGRTTSADTYVVFVPVSTLMARVRVAEPSLSCAVTVPWDDWGPTGTRIVRFEHPCRLSAMGCSVAVTLTTWAGPDATLEVFIFDVHPSAGMQGRARARAQERLKDAEGLLCATDTLSGTRAFAGRITTTFPFELTARRVPLALRELYSSVALMEDGLMLVTPNASS